MKSLHEQQHHHEELNDPSRIFKIGIALNLLFVCIEIYYGVVGQSLALVSDGLHNLSDVFGLTFAWVGYLFSKNSATKKFSIYAAVFNTSLIILTSIWIAFEAIRRYQTNQVPVATTMVAVALIGLLINFFSAQLFHKGHHHDLNMKSAYLHLMADAAVSLGVVIAGGVIYYTGLAWVDPVISGIISLIIIFTTWTYLKQSWNMLVGKPASPEIVDQIRISILRESEVVGVKGIQFRALSTSENSLSAEIRVSKILTDKQLDSLKHRLLHEFKTTSVSFTQVIISD